MRWPLVLVFVTGCFFRPELSGGGSDAMGDVSCPNGLGNWSAPIELTALDLVDAFDEGPALSPDGSVLVWFRNVNNNDLFYSEWNGQTHSLPIGIAQINRSNDEKRPRWSPDGSKLWFEFETQEVKVSDVTYNPVRFSASRSTSEFDIFGAGEMPSITADGMEAFYAVHDTNPPDLYRATWNGTGWNGGQPITELNSTDNENYPSISADGLALYYAHDDFEIFEAKRRDRSSPFDDVTKIELDSGTDLDVFDPAVSRDGRRLYFSRNIDTSGIDNRLHVATRDCL